MFVADVQQMALITDSFTLIPKTTFDVSDSKNSLKLVWGKHTDRSFLAQRCEFNLNALSLHKLNVPGISAHSRFDFAHAPACFQYGKIRDRTQHGDKAVF